MNAASIESAAGAAYRSVVNLTALVTAALALAMAEPVPGTAALEGRIDLIGPPGQPVTRAGTVVWIERAGTAPGATPGPPAMTSRDKRFDPHVIAVPRGTSVRFPNFDPIHHNVFSLSPGNAFDLGLYRRGAERTTTFQAPGIVRVYCNIHPEMAGYVMVLEGAAHAVTAEDGSYRIDGVVPGRHTVHAWNEMAGEHTAVVDIAPEGATQWTLTLDGSAYRRAAHKNKKGKDYPPARDDVDRY